jgi:hypothetical protein
MPAAGCRWQTVQPREPACRHVCIEESCQHSRSFHASLHQRDYATGGSVAQPHWHASQTCSRMGRIASVGCDVACSVAAATICCCRHVPRTLARWADVRALHGCGGVGAVVLTVASWLIRLRHGGCAGDVVCIKVGGLPRCRGAAQAAPHPLRDEVQQHRRREHNKQHVREAYCDRWSHLVPPSVHSNMCHHAERDCFKTMRCRDTS